MKLLMKCIYFGLLFSTNVLTHAATNLIDPTRPADYVEPALVNDTSNKQETTSSQKEIEPEVDYRLHAVKIGRTSRIAIINGETVSTGQTVDSAKVLKILAYSVEMIANGKVFTISLLPDSIKKHSSK